jgi:hypothetical protein
MFRGKRAEQVWRNVYREISRNIGIKMVAKALPRVKME